VKLHKISSNSIQSHLRLKRGWHKDPMYLLNHWRIEEKAIFHNIDIEYSATSKFKEKL
jgi:hypothetical protein